MDSFPDLVTAAFANWNDVKIVVERVGAVSPDALHVIVGVLVQLLFAIVLKRPLSSWLPWIGVLLALFFNESVDLWVERWPSLSMQLAESVKDLVLTMFLPTILTLTFRLSPRLRLAKQP